MTAELATVCVTAVALLALAVWALSSRAEWKRKAIDRANRIVCLRATIAAGTAVDRGVELAHLVLAAADTEHVEADPAGASCATCGDTGEILVDSSLMVGVHGGLIPDRCPDCPSSSVEADPAGAMPRVAPNERGR